VVLNKTKLSIKDLMGTINSISDTQQMTLFCRVSYFLNGKLSVVALGVVILSPSVVARCLMGTLGGLCVLIQKKTFFKKMSCKLYVTSGYRTGSSHG
jgi:hypothetical protein